MASVGGGGAGLANLPSVEQVRLNLSGNSGFGNIGGDECDDFVFTYYGYPDSADGEKTFSPPALALTKISLIFLSKMELTLS